MLIVAGISRLGNVGWYRDLPFAVGIERSPSRPSLNVFLVSAILQLTGLQSFPIEAAERHVYLVANVKCFCSATDTTQNAMRSHQPDLTNLRDQETLRFQKAISIACNLPIDVTVSRTSNRLAEISARGVVDGNIVEAGPNSYHIGAPSSKVVRTKGSSKAHKDEKMSKTIRFSIVPRV